MAGDEKPSAPPQPTPTQPPAAPTNSVPVPPFDLTTATRIGPSVTAKIPKK